MAENLPELRYPVYATYTEGADLGGGNANTWVNEDGGSEEERAYIKYEFTTESGYSENMEDYSNEGQAICFSYDLSKSVYAQKRQFVLGSYAYVKSKSFDFSGSLPAGSAVAYLTGTNNPGRKRMLRGLDSYEYAETDVLFEELVAGAYNPVSRLYLYPQPGITGSGLYADRNYSAEAEVVFCGVKGEYPPYVDVVAEDVVPSVSGAHPNGCFADKSDDINLSWAMTYDEVLYKDFEVNGVEYSAAGRVYGTLTQKSALVWWTQDGGVTIHKIEVDSEGKCIIPAGEVTADSFQWRVQVCSSDGVWSEESQWFTATTDVDDISTAVALRPQKIVVDGTGENTFVWEHSIASLTKPTGADLQYSFDGESWVDFAHYEGRDCQCVVAAEVLPSGVLYWRVRTYNATGTAGEWSEGVIITVRNAPEMPEILSVQERPLPLITWAAEEQIVAEICVDEVTKRVYGQQFSYQWPLLLEAGEHLLKIRVQNQYGLWSKWAETTVLTVNLPLESLLLCGESADNGVRLLWDVAFAKVQVLRDGEIIRELCGGELEYADYESIGRAVYQIRGITEEGYYSDSNELEMVTVVERAVLGREGQWIALRGRYKEPPSHFCKVERSLRYQRFVGFELPVAFGGSQWEKVHQFAFSLKAEEMDKLAALRGLSGERVIYKDARGELVCGRLGAVESTHRGLYADVEFRITETEEGES